MNMINTFNLTILRNRKKASEYGFFEIGKTILDLSLTLLLVALYKFGWQGRAYGILISSIIMGLVSVYHIYRSGYLKFELDTQQIRSILRVSIPFIPYALGTAIITLSDRLFIDQLVNSAAVGIYTVGYQFGMMINLFAMALNQTWSPWMYENLAKDSATSKLRIVKFTYLMCLLYIALAVVVTFISYYLLPIMTSAEYHDAFKYVIWIAMGYSFNGIFALIYPYNVHVGTTSVLGMIGLVGATINLALNYYLIRIGGPVGAAQATLITYVLMTAGLSIYSYRIFPMPWFYFLKK